MASVAVPVASAATSREHTASATFRTGSSSSQDEGHWAHQSRSKRKWPRVGPKILGSRSTLTRHRHSMRGSRGPALIAQAALGSRRARSPQKIGSGGVLARTAGPDIPRQGAAAQRRAREVVIALSGGEILYFEIDESHTLNEVAKRDMNYEVLCLAVQPVPENRPAAPRALRAPASHPRSCSDPAVAPTWRATATHMPWRSHGSGRVCGRCAAGACERLRRGLRP